MRNIQHDSFNGLCYITYNENIFQSDNSLCHPSTKDALCSLVVELTFEQSENVAIARFFVILKLKQLLLAWGGEDWGDKQ